MTRGRFFAIGGLLTLGSVAICLAIFLAADIYVHHRLERYAGVNVWGYRGPRVGRKQANEHRLVVVGGSTAFGYGLVADEAFPAQLQQRLQTISKDGAPVSVVNLSMNTQGAYGFKYALEDYLSLDYDAAILYEGYNDLGQAPNEYVGRHESPVFRLTGYYPVLHIALREKILSLRAGGDLDNAYWGKTVFKPGIAARATAGTLDAARRVGDAFSAQLERMSKVPPASLDYAHIRVSYVGCAWPWEHYCGSVYDAIMWALAHHKKVIVATQPYIGPRHREQQDELRGMLEGWFASNPDVAYVNLGDAVDLTDNRLQFDRVHLTREGNAVIAGRLTAPVAALLPDMFATTPTARASQ